MINQRISEINIKQEQKEFFQAQSETLFKKFSARKINCYEYDTIEYN